MTFLRVLAKNRMSEDWAEEAAAASGGPAVAVAELPEIKLFGKWSTDDVQVSDISLTVSYCHYIF